MLKWTPFTSGGMYAEARFTETYNRRVPGEYMPQTGRNLYTICRGLCVRYQTDDYKQGRRLSQDG